MTSTRPTSAAIVSVVAGTRLLVLLVGLLAVTIVGAIPPVPAQVLRDVSAHEAANLLARWDTLFYDTIATSGYQWDPAQFRRENVVFFPLYPLLMRWGGAALGGRPLLAGLIVSLIAFAGAMMLVYRLARLELGGDYGWRVVLLISTFPYALYYSVVYTESLFLLLTAGAFYAMRRGRPIWLAVCGLASGMTRPNGFWLALPLACLALWPPKLDGPESPRVPRVSPRTALWLLLACAPIVGAIVFSIYLQVRFGDALAWVHGQAAWGTPLLGRLPAVDPPPVPGQPVVTLTEVLVYVGNVAAFVVAVASIRPIARTVGLAYGLWIAVNIFPPVAAHLFVSLGRFTSVLFPVFFWMAIRIRRQRVARVAFAFAAAQLVLAGWFFLWRPVV
ncbi:MAG TPA: mannosyltransferase family protein [Vicinamibacterales bacterium]|jgi:hypothetical protein|nr:mannosyltransferase family protein [Vicinamibacterales bacterium]